MTPESFYDDVTDGLSCVCCGLVKFVFEIFNNYSALATFRDPAEVAEARRRDKVLVGFSGLAEGHPLSSLFCYHT